MGSVFLINVCFSLAGVPGLLFSSMNLLESIWFDIFLKKLYSLESFEIILEENGSKSNNLM